MTIGEVSGRKARAEEILDEVVKKREERINVQYGRVLAAFKTNLEENDQTTFCYSIILYDEVRERLEKEGFIIKTIYDKRCEVSYSITIKE